MEIRKISFTGSSRTGRFSASSFLVSEKLANQFERAVAQAAAMSNLKAVSLELGGKSPTIIFEDADIAQAVAASSFSIQWNSGQVRCSPSESEASERETDEGTADLHRQLAPLRAREDCRRVHDPVQGCVRNLQARRSPRRQHDHGVRHRSFLLERTATDGSLARRPQADDIQGKSVLNFIEIGKKDGKLEMGGERVGDKVRSPSPRSSER